MSTETAPEKAPSKKKILNKAKYAVISFERAVKRIEAQIDKLEAQRLSARNSLAAASNELDVLLAA